MEEIILIIAKAFRTMLEAVVQSLTHNWIPLAVAMLLTAVTKAYVDAEKLKERLLSRPKVSILVSVGFGAFTPFCACGTMAVIIGMLTTTLPWGPVMAFLTSSPLMSPDGFVMLAGIISLRFAIALTIASVAIGLSSGYLTHLIEKKTQFLKNQTRFSKLPHSCGCSGAEEKETVCSEKHDVQLEKRCGCSSAPQPTLAYEFTRNQDKAATVYPSCCVATTSVNVDLSDINPPTKTGFHRITVKQPASKIKWKEIWNGFYQLGIKQILLFFSIFVAIGSLINMLVPSSLVAGLLGADNLAAVPLATLIGLPLYITTDSAIPIIKSLIASGASEGAMMSFMISGAATSAWVIAGISSFLKKKAVGLYLLFIIAGAILTGYFYDLFILLI